MKVSEEIELTLITEADAADVFRAIDGNRDSLREWLPFVDYTETEADSTAFIQSTEQTGELVFVIRYGNSFAGLIGLKAFDDVNHKAEIGYWITPELEGKGLVTRSCQRLIEYAFDELGMNRLLICVATGNRRSRMVPARLGFFEEGIEREGELLASGLYTDLVRYSLLKSEYDESM